MSKILSIVTTPKSHKRKEVKRGEKIIGCKGENNFKENNSKHMEKKEGENINTFKTKT